MHISRKEFLGTALASAGSMAAGAGRQAEPKGSARKGGRMKWEVRRLDLKHAWTISRNSSTFKENVFVSLSSGGTEGVGEAAPNVRYQETPASTTAFLEKARPLVEQSDWWQFQDLMLRVHALEEGQTAAKAAIDIALLDWVGKKLGIPLYRFWGLDPAKVPVTTMSIGIDTPEIMQQKVAEAEAFPVLKIKLGTPDDRRNMEAIRRVTRKPLRVDANEGWKTREQALENIDWLAGQGVEFVEQPMPSSMLEDIRWLKERSRLPLVADESVRKAADIPQLAAAFHGINIKLMKAGGPQEALRMVQMARALGMKIMLGCMVETSVAIAAAVHMAPLVDWLDLDGNLLIARDLFTGLTLRQGRWILPDSSGLGVHPV